MARSRDHCDTGDRPASSAGEGNRWRHLGQRGGSVHRVLRLENGSYTIEGLAALIAFFVLLVLVVQIAMLAVARTTVEASVDGAARRATFDPDAVAEIESHLRTEIEAAVPGADVVLVAVELTGHEIGVVASIRWRPPGPDLVPITMTVSRSRPVVVPP